jgi:cation transport ATPase
MLLAVVVVSLQHFDATCAGCVERLLKTQPGVLNASVDCKARSPYIDYDSRIVSGESIPVFKRAGAPVFAGTINQRGGLEIRVSKVARDSTLARLIRMVEESQAEKANTQRFLENAERSYAAGVIFFTGLLIALCVIVVLAASALGFHLALPIGVVGHEGSTVLVCLNDLRLLAFRG